MTLRPARAAVAAVACLMLSLTAGPMVPGAAAGQPAGYGPSDPFDDALMGDNGPVEPMKNLAKIVRTKYGYRYTAGQQDSRLTVTLTKAGKLRFRDAGTRSWKSLPAACTSRRVSTGIAAVCRVPASTSAADPTLLEIHPRLGNDHIDGRSLPASFEMAVLADAGRDVVYTGKGNDFVNGAQDADRIHGGPGRDWIRGGKGNDRIWGGAGGDYLVGQDGKDAIYGGAGKDRIYQ